MFSLFFNDDGNVRTDFAGDRFGGELKSGGRRNAELHTAGCGLQIPIALAAWISLHVDAPGGSVGSHIPGSTMNFNLATGGIRLDAASGLRDANDSREGTHSHITFHIRNGDAARSAGDVDVAADVTDRDGTAGGGELSVAVNFFDANRAGSGLHLYRATKLANGLRARGDGSADLSVVRYLNGVSNGDVAHAGHVFTDANGIASLLDGRIRKGVVGAFLRVVKPESRSAYVAVHVHLAVGAASDAHITRGIAQLQANGTGNRIVAIEATGYRRSGAAAGNGNNSDDEHQ